MIKNSNLVMEVTPREDEDVKKPARPAKERRKASNKKLEKINKSLQPSAQNHMVMADTETAAATDEIPD